MFVGDEPKESSFSLYLGESVLSGLISFFDDPISSSVLNESNLIILPLASFNFILPLFWISSLISIISFILERAELFKNWIDKRMIYFDLSVMINNQSYFIKSL